MLRCNIMLALSFTHGLKHLFALKSLDLAPLAFIYFIAFSSHPKNEKIEKIESFANSFYIFDMDHG